MTRSLQVLLRRDPTRDRQDDKIHFEGYQFIWPDGRPVTVGLDALCSYGQRLFNLKRHLAGRKECRMELVWLTQPHREAAMTRLPGHRVRRFCLIRQDRQGRVHFIDGTPTAIVFDLDRDEKRVLDWVGLPDMREGEEQWFDLAAQPVNSASRPVPTTSNALSGLFPTPSSY